METIKQVLMRRDRLSAEEAQEMLDEARKESAHFLAGEPGARNPEEILYEDFGLEPDYIWELI